MPAEQAAILLEQPTLADAQRLFSSARYEDAAALTLTLRASGAESLATNELRSSALLFQLKALLEKRPERDDVLEYCGTCPALIADFLAETRRGREQAHATLGTDPNDDDALFFLGKLDLNYVWLQLGPCAAGLDGTSTGRRDARSTRSSNAICRTSERASRVRGSTISSTPKCRGARSGCSAAATGSRR